MSEKIALLHVVLVGSEPAIWRRVAVPVRGSLRMIHDIIQGAMGWQDYHLWEFIVGDKRYGMPEPGWRERGLFTAKNIRLQKLIERGVEQFDYVYDMGDDWLHRITIEAVEDGEPGLAYPRLLDGARRAPPEDVGGIPGFQAFLEAMADPAHPEHEAMVAWYGEVFDPETFDQLAAEYRIGSIARRRTAGKAAYARSRAG